LLDFGELPRAEIGTEEQAREDGACVFLRASAVKDDAFRGETKSQVVQ
jgi:hypothetical protein